MATPIYAIQRHIAMDVYDTVYAVFAANDNTIRGNTVIQKLVYLSSVKIPELDVPPYKPHYFGPFSPELGWALEKMVAYYFIYEANVPGRIHEGCKYGLTSDGQEIAEKIKEKNSEMFEKIAKIVSVCSKYCRLKMHPLSYASKIYYLCSHENMTFSDAKEYARKLEWKVPKEDVDKGAELLEQLDLVRISK